MTDLKKAILLDRDGVINDNSIAYYIYKIEDFRLNDGVLQVLKHFIKQGYMLIIITNQGGIAKKQYTSKIVDELHQHLKNILESNGIKITDIYYCPHHSDISKCLCRKPGSLMIEKAIANYGIDTEKSYMIGDSVHDIEAAAKLNIKGIKVTGNLNLYESIQNTTFSYLLD